MPTPLEFYAASGERSNPDGQLTVKKRIAAIFEQVKKRHSRIFDRNDEIKLKPRSLAYIISEITWFSILIRLSFRTIEVGGLCICKGE